MIQKLGFLNGKLEVMQKRIGILDGAASEPEAFLKTDIFI